jgi:FkbM family methyltransferase
MHLGRLLDKVLTLLRTQRLLSPGVAALRRLREPRLSTVLDRLAALLAEDPVISVPEFQGRFAVSVRSHLFRRVIKDGAYEPDLARLCISLLDPERDVIDVGANVGFYSVLLARNLNKGRVLAVEPTEGALRRLRKNLEMNGVGDKVVVVEGVVSSAQGAVNIHTVEGAEEYSSVKKQAHPAARGRTVSTRMVQGKTVDALTEEFNLRPGLIKIDVEGFEEHVINGATETLKRYRPIIVSELSDYLLRRNGASAQGIVKSLQALGYKVTDPHHPQELPGYREFGDIVCVPR